MHVSYHIKLIMANAFTHVFLRTFLLKSSSIGLIIVIALIYVFFYRVHCIQIIYLKNAWHINSSQACFIFSVIWFGLQLSLCVLTYFDRAMWKCPNCLYTRFIINNFYQFPQVRRQHLTYIGSVENQKGINAVEQCSIENQKGAICHRICTSFWFSMEHSWKFVTMPFWLSTDDITFFPKGQRHLSLSSPIKASHL